MEGIAYESLGLGGWVAKCRINLELDFQASL